MGRIIAEMFGQSASGELSALYAEHAPRFRRMLLRSFGRGAFALSVHDVEDAIHEGFLRLLDHVASNARHPLEPKWHTSDAYVAAVARNLCVDAIRARRRDFAKQREVAQWQELCSASLSRPEQALDAERIEGLQAYVSQLDDGLSDVYHHRFILELSQVECAHRLGLTRRQVRTIETHITRGLARRIATQTAG